MIKLNMNKINTELKKMESELDKLRCIKCGRCCEIPLCPPDENGVCKCCVQKVIITKGLPASGKSTWSKQWVKDNPRFKRINRDDLRLMIYQGEWSDEKEKAVLLAREVLFKEFIKAGYSVVLDDTNLAPWRLQETLDMIKAVGITPTIKDFTDVPLELCIKRDSERPDLTRVGEKFIREYYEKYIPK